MATLRDDKRKVIVKPEYSNWWSFYFNFSYNEKPLLNPDILRDQLIKADQYDEGDLPLLNILRDALDSFASNDSGKIFSWGAWEDEVEVHVKPVSQGNSYNISIAISEDGFKDSESVTDPFVSINFSVERQDLQNFYDELRQEMSDVAKKDIDELNQKTDGDYSGHLKVLQPYVMQNK